MCTHRQIHRSWVWCYASVIQTLLGKMTGGRAKRILGSSQAGQPGIWQRKSTERRPHHPSSPKIKGEELFTPRRYFRFLMPLHILHSTYVYLWSHTHIHTCHTQSHHVHKLRIFMHTHIHLPASLWNSELSLHMLPSFYVTAVGLGCRPLLHCSFCSSYCPFKPSISWKKG